MARPFWPRLRFQFAEIRPLVHFGIRAAAANIFEKEAITGLAKTLKLDASDPVAAAKLLGKQLSQQSQDLNKQMRPMQTRVTEARNKLQQAVYFRYPELRDPWLPASEKLRLIRLLKLLPLCPGPPYKPVLKVRSARCFYLCKCRKPLGSVY